MNFKVNALNACVEISRSLYAIKWLELNKNVQIFKALLQKNKSHYFIAYKMIFFACKAIITKFYRC